MPLSQRPLLCLLLIVSVLGHVARNPSGGGPDDRPEVLLRDLERDLGAPYPDKRRRTVRKLVELAEGEAAKGTVGRGVPEKAWRLVIERLGDASGQVADEVQVQLEQLSIPRVHEELLGRAGLGARGKRDRLLRFRVAEALGRSALPVEGKALLRHVARREPELSRALLWSVERLARDEKLVGERGDLFDEVADIHESGMRTDARVRGAALFAGWALAPDRSRSRVLAALQDPAPEVRCAALSLLAHEPASAFEATEVFELMRRRLRDESPSVRAAALENVARAADRGAVLELVGLLERTEPLRLRLRATEHLRELSGLFYRHDPRPWRRWAEALPEDWVAEPDDRDDTIGEGVSAVAASLPVNSDRVCFLVDFSGSQWNERADGRTRKQAAEVMLAEALSNLAPDALFNVVPYTREPIPWRERLQPVSERNLLAAAEFFEKCSARGTGNFFDALRFALEDERTDTVVVLTDGVPTGGARWHLGLMVTLLLEEQRYRRVALDSVLVKAPGGVRRHWEELARQTGGSCVSID